MLIEKIKVAVLCLVILATIMVAGCGSNHTHDWNNLSKQALEKKMQTSVMIKPMEFGVKEYPDKTMTGGVVETNHATYRFDCEFDTKTGKLLQINVNGRKFK